MLLATHGRFGTVMQARGRPLGVLYSVLKAALFLACLDHTGQYAVDFLSCDACRGRSYQRPN